MEIDLIPVLLREHFGTRQLPREPEPQSMDGSEQVDAYFSSGSDENGIMAVSNLFHAAHATQVLHGCKKVLDLGCGPAIQLARIAELNPDCHFVGVDLSIEMLDRAHTLIAKNRLSNIEVVKGDITKLEQFSDASFDGIISTVTLHHLPRADDLARSFYQMSRVLRARGAIYLADFSRLKSLKSVLYFAYKYRHKLPHVLCLDYERSLRAAFLSSDFQKQMHHLASYQAILYITRVLPFMLAIKTKDRDVSPDIKIVIKNKRLALPQQYRNELDDLRLLFRMSGLNDSIFT
ncbi:MULTISPECIES: class I SAM-dependent methyltransferase [Methylomonas]|nr:MULTISPECIES: class I SAM-dependent methyltransferase [Methylomonas]TCV80209.1 methyltransferase family protein [Methylomonas methanica]